MLTCKDASRLISQSQDRELSLSERLALRVHLAVCGACVRVTEQFDFLRKALARYAERDANPEDKH